MEGFSMDEQLRVIDEHIEYEAVNDKAQRLIIVSIILGLFGWLAVALAPGFAMHLTGVLIFGISYVVLCIAVGYEKRGVARRLVKLSGFGYAYPPLDEWRDELNEKGVYNSDD